MSNSSTHPILPGKLPGNDAIPGLLIVINLIGIAVGYAITMVLARHLEHGDFEQYITAIATLGLLATIGEAGFGKYALRIVPVYRNMASQHPLRAYIRYALVATLWLSLSVVVVACLLELTIRSGEDRYVVLVAITMLPLVSLSGVVVDLLLALRLATWGMFVCRILIPLTTLTLIIWRVSASTITPLQSVYCFAGGSVVGLFIGLWLCSRQTHEASSTSELESPVTFSWKSWTAASFSFMAFYFLLAWISRSTLVIASHLPHETGQLAILAPAFETGCLILLLSKSTDKYFQPNMSSLLESTQWQEMIAMRNARLKIIGSCVAIFLVVILVFGAQILRIYGEDFAAGYKALCVFAVGSSVWTLFSLSPSFLMYSGGQRLVLKLLAVHAVLLALLMIALFPSFGAIGAAMAYTVTVTSFSLANLFFARTRFEVLSSEAGLPSASADKSCEVAEEP